MSTVRPPTHIALPRPPVWHDYSPDPPSPYAQFYTPPSSPAPSPSIFYTPPTSPFHDLEPPVPPPPPAAQAPPPPAPAAPALAPAPVAAPPTDDPFPDHVDLAIDLPLDDDGLSTLEKIYLYSRSRAAFHRVFIAHALPEYLLQVTPQEAVEYVQPLLSGLAMDSDELVKEALAAELVPVIWWFFTHCQIIPDDLRPEEAYASSSTTVTISVQAFTPILGTLLLSSNPLVGGAARVAVVDLLSRMRKADDRELGAIHRHHPPRSPGELHHPWELSRPQRDDDDDDDEAPLVVGLFGRHERAMFTQEILQQVVIGMARLDVLSDAESAHPEEAEPQVGHVELDRSNPYFPPSPPANQQPQLYASHASRHPALSSPNESSPRFAHPSDGSQSYSPGTEFPPTEQAASARTTAALHALQQGATPTGARPTLSPSSAAQQTPEIDINDDLEGISYEEEEDQAAVGRLSSMSLMAAVTANGALEEETQRAFVQEVQRVGQDPIYWVRREASFALGALAKVVPDDVVMDSLLPLFDTLRWDPAWHVRHSALFALPAILSRLSAAQRRTVALETITTLAKDQNATVRSGVLEALGEVIYTFHEDPEGPPQRLIDLFLGRREDRPGLPTTTAESIYDDPKRHLICAFNFPAVALTLGGHRWAELRDVYLAIHADDSPGVRHTFAASLGELAKIIGSEHAQRDLVEIWRSTMKSDDEEVRSGGIKSLADFIGVVGTKTGLLLLESLLTAWNTGTMKGWRERGLVMQNLVSWVALIGFDSASLGRAFLVKALEDNVAAVRETAISIVPDLYSFCSSTNTLSDLLHDLHKLATSSNYRRRMTFIACQQSLFVAVAKNGQPLISCDDDFLRSIADFASDAIEGVRIGVSRLTAVVHGNLIRHSRAIPSVLHDFIHKLSQDSSHEVRSYVAKLSVGNAAGDSDASLASSRQSRKCRTDLATFSRPPPAPSYSSPSHSDLDQPQDSPGVKHDMARTFSGSSGEAVSSSDDDGSLSSPQAGGWSTSSTPDSIRSVDDHTASATPEGSAHFSDPPKTLLASVRGVC